MGKFLTKTPVAIIVVEYRCRRKVSGDDVVTHFASVWQQPYRISCLPQRVSAGHPLIGDFDEEQLTEMCNARGWNR